MAEAGPEVILDALDERDGELTGRAKRAMLTYMQEALRKGVIDVDTGRQREAAEILCERAVEEGMADGRAAIRVAESVMRAEAMDPHADQSDEPLETVVITRTGEEEVEALPEAVTYESEESDDEGEQ